MHEGIRLHLAGSGGGTGCAAGAGAITRLYEQGVIPHASHALSGDALNLGLAAAGQVEHLRPGWTSGLAREKFTSLARALFSRDLRRYMDLKGLIYRMIKPVFDEDAYRRSPTLVSIGVTEKRKRAGRFFTNRDTVDPLKVFEATEAIPGLADPVDIEGETYEDGMLSFTLGDLVKKAKAEGANFVIALDSQWGPKRKPVQAKADPDCELVVVRPSRMPLHPLTADARTNREAFDAGYSAVKNNAHLQGLLKDAGI